MYINPLQFRRLLEPGKIGNLELPNRMIMAPMATLFAGPDGHVTEQLIGYYVARARGGVGLIVIEAAFPRRFGHPGRIFINDEKCVVGLARLATAIHEAGCKVLIQLNPSRGRADEVEPACASAGALPLGKIIPKEVTKEGIAVLVEEFGEGVGRACSAGFDGIMVHGAHGYLVSDFLSPATNRRRDEYGGSTENRARFARELVISARRKAGANYPITFRISADDHIQDGLRPEESALICRILEQAGVDAIDISAGAIGIGQSEPWISPLGAIPLGCNKEAAKVVKDSITIPVAVAGRINDPYLAQDILKRGQADFISLGRALIADPDFPNKVKEGRAHQIRKCIACSNCVSNIEVKTSITCTVNVAVGKERVFVLEPAAKKRKILVIGGGPAGLEAAKVAALRGHQVEVWEKTSKLGGQVNLATVPPHKQEVKHILDYQLSQLETLQVPIKLNQEATTDSVARQGPDVVIVATGASPLIPKMSGIVEALAENTVVTAWDVLSGRAKVGESVIIIGGNLVGCETAEFLAEQGKAVTIVKRRPRMAIDMYINARRALMRRLRNNKNITLMTGIECKSITGDGYLEATDSSGRTVRMRAESLVLAMGAVPNNQLPPLLRQNGLEVREIGDCVQPRKLLEALKEGAAVGADI